MRNEGKTECACFGSTYPCDAGKISMALSKGGSPVHGALHLLKGGGGRHKLGKNGGECEIGKYGQS